RTAAAVLALSFFTPVAPILHYLVHVPEGTLAGLSHLDNEVPAAVRLWGYAPAAIAVGLVPLCLLGVERVLDPGRRRKGCRLWWYLAWTSLAALFAAWLHPWQGEVLIGVLGGLALWERSVRRTVALCVPAAAALAPLLYYEVLAHTDQSWRLAEHVNEIGHPPAWAVVAAFGPLAVPAALAYRGRADDVQERLLRLWPLAALAAYALTANFSIHVLEGVSIPLAVLAVRGARSVRF